MIRDASRRLAVLEKRQPTRPRRVAIVVEDAPAPVDADFVIRICAARFPGDQHA